MIRQETWSHSTWFDKCSIHYAYSVSTLWCSQVLLYCFHYCTYQYIVPKVTTKFFLFRCTVHEYASELTSIPKAEIFCNCKRRKFMR